MIPASSNPRAPKARPSLPPASTPSPLIQSGREIELESEVHGLRAQLAALAVELASVRDRICEESEPEIVSLAMTVASRVVGRELTTDPSVVLDWIQEGFALLPGRDEAVVVAVAPDVAALISRDESATAALEGKRLVVDASLRAGSCELREGSSIVSIGAVERLAAISDALGVHKDG